MGKSAKKTTLTPEEKETIKQFKLDLIQSGITDPKEQAQFIQQELSMARTKTQEEKRRNSPINRIFTRLKEIIRPITDKFLKKMMMRNQPDMEAQFKQMFEGSEQGQDEMQGLPPIYDQFKDQAPEDLQENGTFVDDRPKLKKKPVFFDEDEK